MNRRGFLTGMLFAPATIRLPGLLMPVSTRLFKIDRPPMTLGEEVMNRIAEVIWKDMEPAYLDLMFYGSGAVRTGLLYAPDLADRLKAEFIPPREIYREFNG